MPPTHLPPTPAASGEFTIKESSFHAMDAMTEHSFALPPAALSPIMPGSSTNPSSRKGSMAAQTPVSPASPGIAAAIERRASTNVAARVGTKRAAATSIPSSTALDEFNLPPPPTRSRKIIQMKPKTAASSASDVTGTTTTTKQSSQKKAAPKSGSAPFSKNGSTLAATAIAPPTNINNTSLTSQQSNNSNNNGSKRKQPSATSAAGRKIARKTAHSLIERRRRSKMNEEFATLKDMIPACRGQEMHKLAILQASIDYMNYLEECITELKNNASSAAGRTNSISKKLKLDAPPLVPLSPTSPELIMPPIEGSEESAGSESSASSPEPLPQHTNNIPTTNSSSTPVYYSPSFSPYTAPIPSHKVAQSLDSGNHPILPSPALRQLYSPQIRPQPQTQLDLQQHTNNNPAQLPNIHSNTPNTTSWRVQQPIASATPSPAIQPQQHRQSLSAASLASPVFLATDSQIDHEASAALLMLNMDRRGLSISERGEGERREGRDEKSPSSSSSANERKMGMSVRDLLTS